MMADKSIINAVSKLHDLINDKDGMKFSYTVKEDIEYLNSFPEPQDDIERSYFQYVCQRRNQTSKLINIAYDLISLFAIIPLTIVLLIFGCLDIFKTYEKYDAVFVKDFEKMKIAPTSLLKSIDNYVVHSMTTIGNMSLSVNDLVYIIKIYFRYPFAYYFLLKAIVRIASYSCGIRRYAPKMVCNTYEYSSVSSILTDYCNNHNVSHVNIMHGEKLFFLREAFSHFDLFYVWDEHYLDLFNSLRANKTKYIVERPKQLELLCNVDVKNIVYYLQLHTEEQLRTIRKSLIDIGIPFKVRPHPSHFNDSILSVFEASEIEDCYSVSIIESLSSAKAVISIDSTVLLQAYWYGLPIIIDDISNAKLYEELKERKYIMINKPHDLLSELIKR